VCSVAVVYSEASYRITNASLTLTLILTLTLNPNLNASGTAGEDGQAGAVFLWTGVPVTVVVHKIG